MEPFDLDALLEGFRTSRARICFYPSSGSDLLWTVMRLNADVFVFADYIGRVAKFREDLWNQFRSDCSKQCEPLTSVYSSDAMRAFKCGEKVGLLLFQDDNEFLEKLYDDGCRISILVGFCDGCAEGGNYECVHEDPFLGKVVSLAQSPFQYFTDHSDLLESCAETSRFGHRYFRQYCAHSTGWEFTLRCVLVDIGDELEAWYRNHWWYESKFDSRRCEEMRVEALRNLTLVCFNGEKPKLRYSCGEDAASTFELSKLAEFRMRRYGDRGNLAQYEVRKLRR